MKMECEVIQDLLPLYVEKIASEQSAVLVEEHLKECEACQKSYEEMIEKTPQISEEETVKVPLEKIKNNIRRRKINAVGFAAALVFTLLMTVYSYLTTPIYLSMEEAGIRVYEENDALFMSVSAPVEGYYVEEALGDNGQRLATVEVWSSSLEEMKKDKTTIVKISDSAEDVDAVYYTDYTKEDNLILVYGKEAYLSDGGVVLPRLALGFYDVVMLAAAVGLGILFFIFRRKKCGVWIRNLWLVPVCYLLSQLLLSIDTVTYSMQRDFKMIVLVGAGLYGVILFGIRMWNDRVMSKK